MAKTIRVSVTVTADPSQAFETYTDPEQMICWLCEGAAIDLDNGAFALWGSSIPGVPEGNDGNMHLVDAVPDRRLEVAWKLLDDDTTFTVTFEPQGDATKVGFEHTGIEDNDWAWTVGSFWATQAENFRAWIERGVAGPRFDYRTLAPGDIEVSAEIDAPAGEVFKALIDPEMVGQWMMSDNVTIEPEVGGSYDLAGWDQDGPVKIVDLDPDEKLSYSWHSDWVGHETLVTWELAESAGKTRLTLVHSGFAPDARHDSYRTGWLGFLVQIKYLVEEGPDRSPVDWEIIDAVAV
ncbi:MAG: SRPBCC domain-containing protein [Thermomicrobiales bacterium]